MPLAEYRDPTFTRSTAISILSAPTRAVATGIDAVIANTLRMNEDRALIEGRET